MNGTQKRWCLFAAAAGLISLGGTLFQPTVVVGQSMSPTLKDGRVIWIDRTYYTLHKPERGEVVVFRRDGVTYVKRVYRAPGETVHYLAAGSEWVAPIREDRVSEMERRYQGTRTMIRVRAMPVPEDAVFVLGDNLLMSEDSRQLGAIPLSSIIGRAHLAQNTTLSRRYEIAPRTTRPHPRASAEPGPGPGRLLRVRNVTGHGRELRSDSSRQQRT